MLASTFLCNGIVNDNFVQSLWIYCTIFIVLAPELEKIVAVQPQSAEQVINIMELVKLWRKD